MSQDMELWKQIFQELIQEVKPWHKWTLTEDKALLPNSLKPGWSQYQQWAFARFQCSLCSRNWASSQVQVIFHMHKNEGKPGGNVKMRVFAQRCKKCHQSPFEVPEFTKENISRILNNLVFRILKKCYREGFKSVEEIPTIKEISLEGPHDSNNCEACLQGFCAQSGLSKAMQSPVSPSLPAISSPALETTIPMPSPSRSGTTADTVKGRVAADIVKGRAIADRVKGSSTMDIEKGNTTADTVKGRVTADIVKGRATADRVKGSSTMDIEKWNTTADRVKGSSTMDIEKWNTTADRVKGSSTVDIEKGNTTADRVKGSYTVDIEKGNTTADTVKGRVTADIVKGRATADIVKGRAIADRVKGSSTMDIEKWNTTADRVKGSSTVDIEKGNTTADRVKGSYTVDIEKWNTTADRVKGSSTVDIEKWNTTADRVKGSSTVDIEKGNTTADRVKGSYTVDIEKRNSTVDTVKESTMANEGKALPQPWHSGSRKAAILPTHWSPRPNTQHHMERRLQVRNWSDMPYNHTDQNPRCRISNPCCCFFILIIVVVIIVETIQWTST